MFFFVVNVKGTTLCFCGLGFAFPKQPDLCEWSPPTFWAELKPLRFRTLCQSFPKAKSQTGSLIFSATGYFSK